MLQYRSCGSVKVKGHAPDAMVADGRVRREDKDGNDAADIVADFTGSGHLRGLLLLGEIFSGLKRSGLHDYWFCTDSRLPFCVRPSIMMMEVVRGLMPWSRIKVLGLRFVRVTPA